jgi:hypothetical protein
MVEEVQPGPSVAPGKQSKKQIRRTIREKLSVTLADYKGIVGEKKFESRIRKAARQLGADIARAIPKRSKKLKKAV